MSVKIINEDNKVIALLSGEIDHHNAKSLRQDIDFSLRENQPEELIRVFLKWDLWTAQESDWLWAGIS